MMSDNLVLDSLDLDSLLPTSLLDAEVQESKIIDPVKAQERLDALGELHGVTFDNRTLNKIVYRIGHNPVQISKLETQLAMLKRDLEKAQSLLPLVSKVKQLMCVLNKQDTLNKPPRRSNKRRRIEYYDNEQQEQFDQFDLPQTPRSVGSIGLSGFHISNSSPPPPPSRARSECG